MTTFLRVKNLKKHQHYKNRRPPWIKLHAEVLDDYAFGCLQDASKAHLMLIWVLASRVDNRIPNDPAWIARKLGLTDTIDVAALVSAGFIEVCDDNGNVVQDASAPLAPRTQTSMPETETETETETEKSNSPAAAVASAARRARPTTPRPAPSRPALKHPHYPVQACTALYDIWTERRGPIDMARFRKQTAPLFPSATPPYELETLAGALKLCLAVTKHRASVGRDGYEWRTLTPEAWVGRIVEWVEHYRRVQADASHYDTLLPPARVPA